MDHKSLATVVYLLYSCYFKLRFSVHAWSAMIIMQAFRYLEYPDGYTVVWAYDGNIKYFSEKHTSLFIVALLSLILLFLPFTLFCSWVSGSKCFKQRQSGGSTNPLSEPLHFGTQAIIVSLVSRTAINLLCQPKKLQAWQ